MFPGGEPEADEKDYLRTMDNFLRGEIDWDEDYETISDYLFTREITQMKTVADATIFVNKLWVTLSVNEKRYVLDVYHGRNTTVSNMLIIQDKLNAMREYVARLERDREAEMEYHRSRLAPDLERVPDQAQSERFTPLSDLYEDQLTCLVEALESAESEVSAMGDTLPPEVYGGGEVPKKLDGDLRLYKILALCDSFHDLGRAHKVKFQEAVGAELPQGLTLDVLAKEDKAIGFFENNAALDFGSGDVLSHSLHGRKLLHQHKVRDLMEDNHNEYWLAYRQQYKKQDATASLRSVDLWCLPQFEEAKEVMIKEHKIPPKGHKSVVYLSQIAGIVASIKERFGDGNLTFVMDKSDDQLARLLMATSKLDAAIGKLHIVKEGELGIVIDETRLDTEDDPEPREKWTYAVCDAAILDGNTHIRTGNLPYPNPTVLKDATGHVYPKGFPVLVHFDGVEGTGDDLSVQVTINDEMEVYKELVKQKKYPELYLGADPRKDPEFDNHNHAPFSTSNMRFVVENDLKKGRDIGTYLAQKRACDWGQIEHCVKYGTPGNRYIFVSKDRLACLFAMYRNVDFIYMGHMNQVQNSSWDTPVIMQVTFNMCRSLTHEEMSAALPVDDTQRGGGIRALHVVLSAVVVAATVIGSVVRH